MVEPARYAGPRHVLRNHTELWSSRNPRLVVQVRQGIKIKTSSLYQSPGVEPGLFFVSEYLAAVRSRRTSLSGRDRLSGVLCQAGNREIYPGP